MSETKPTIRSIAISFPEPITLTREQEQRLVSLIGEICEAYEDAHPDRVMWPFGIGFAPVWDEPNEPGTDYSTYQIECSEREAYESEIKRRAHRRKKSDV